MTKKYNQSSDDLVRPFYINGLEGRVLKAESRTTKKKHILYVYDLVDSLENSWGMIENLRSYGHVSCVDLPGVGGMTSFSKIKYPVNIDSYADYLAAFIRLNYKRKKITIVGKGFGFAVATRMLIKYPLLVGKVSLVVSIGGYVHHEDFKMSRRNKSIYIHLCRILSVTPLSYFYKICITSGSNFDKLDKKFNSIRKFVHLYSIDAMDNPNTLSSLWKTCSSTSYWRMMSELLKLDNCTKRVSVPLRIAYVAKSQVIDHKLQREHLQITFKDYKEYEIEAECVLSEDARKLRAHLLPKALRRVLANAKA